MPHLSLHSPVGDLTLSEADGFIVSLDWGWAATQEPSPLLDEARRQIESYFDGNACAFNLPLRPPGTPFQLRVWAEISKISHGNTTTYRDISDAVASHPRAVGLACARNPVPILIPCHRVVAKNGALTGYSGDGGTETKAALLHLEGADAAASPDLFAFIEPARLS